MLEAASPSGYLLREAYRSCILKVGSSNLYYVLVLLLKLLKSINHVSYSRHEFICHCCNSRNMHCCRECVIRTLGHVDVVIRMKQIFSGCKITHSCNYLVHIHVGLSSASGLPYGQRKFSVESAGKDDITHSSDKHTSSVVKLSESVISYCGSLLQNRKCPYNLFRHLIAAYREVLKASLRLCAPHPVLRDKHLT